MGMKLYVGNLAFETTSEDLKQLFAEAGTVEEVTIVEDPQTGRSKGFGFVEMSSETEAETAIEKFHGRELFGSGISVHSGPHGVPRGPRGGRGGRDSSGGRGGGLI